VESKEVVRARQEYELADERMEKIFNEALAEVEKLKADNKYLREARSRLMADNIELDKFREALEKIRGFTDDSDKSMAVRIWKIDEALDKALSPPT